MKLAYVTIKDSEKLGKQTEWSGTGYYISQSLQNRGISVDHVGPLQDSFLPHAVRKIKRHFYQSVNGKLYLKDSDPLTLRSYAQQVSKSLSRSSYDVIFSATVNPIAFLECKSPIIFWADATFQNIAEFYSKYSDLCMETVENSHTMERAAIQKCKFAVYSSHWAAQTAVEFYDADPEKVKIVPFGANLESNLTEIEVKDIINSRPSTICKIVLIGVDWSRKGGDKALEVATALNDAGLPTELTLIGCQPEDGNPLPSFVKPLGYISKFTQSGQDRIAKVIAESHFLILPTLADCSPIVLCEANAFGVPTLTTDVGGIPTIVNPDVNGRLFNPKATTAEYCHCITNLFSKYHAYKELALSSFNEYKSRLNWDVSGQAIQDLCTKAIE